MKKIFAKHYLTFTKDIQQLTFTNTVTDIHIQTNTDKKKKKENKSNERDNICIRRMDGLMIKMKGRQKKDKEQRTS